MNNHFNTLRSKSLEFFNKMKQQNNNYHFKEIQSEFPTENLINNNLNGNLNGYNSSGFNGSNMRFVESNNSNGKITKITN